MTHIDDQGHVVMDVTRADGTHVDIVLPDECETCQDTGYLLNQSYELADIPDDWTPVQRCDTCERFEGDDDAATAAAGPNGVVAFWFASGDLPGDYAFRLTA